MERISLSNYKSQTKIFWWLMLLAATAFCGVSIHEVRSFSAAQFAALFASVIIAMLVNQHQFKVSGTRITLSAKEFIIFWGVLWLGVPGGTLIALAVTVGEFFSFHKDKHGDNPRWMLHASFNVIEAFVSGQVFYLILKYLADFKADVVADSLVISGWLTLALLAMALSQYIISNSLNFAFFKLEKEYSLQMFRSEDFVPSLAKYAVAVTATALTHFAFYKFGLYFSLVILPVVTLGNLAYRLHLKRFEQKTKEITEASRIHLATVEALATAIDARDQVGMGHVRRTQIYAVGIGEMLGLSTPELEALNTSALLHDIGKLAVPDHILNKPGRLTPAELEKTKIHASVGASILEKVNFPYPVVPTVRHHHEMWDGSGYPDGLKGNDIPLTARILTVADAYDTLRGAKPYRKPLSRDEARRIISINAGKHFDPTVVSFFLKNLSKFEAIIEEQGFGYSFDKENVGDFHTTLDDGSEQSYVEQIKRANREVFTLYELARVFSSSINLQETLSLFTKKIGELVPYDTCIVYLMDEAEDFAKAAYIEGENSPAFKNKRVRVGEGATGFVLKQRKPVHNVEPGLDFTYSNFEYSQAYLAMASLPLFVDDKLFGAVSLYSHDLENYEVEHMRLLDTIARIGSDAIGKLMQHAESESRALTDPMTNLPNARSLQMQFEKEVARANRNEASFHLLMLDLDGFKAVNDTFGHKAGDHLLKQLAEVMTAQLREYDFLARYAGDEFVAIVPETDEQGIQELSQRLEKAVDECVLPLGEGKSARVGVSIGIGCYPNNGTTLDQIIIHADEAMYAVKANRKQRRQNQMTAALVLDENFIVEIDESHIVSAALN